MPYFGNIFIPWITDKDTSISKDTVEKNFVDEDAQVYELTPDLEAGTYSAILNEAYHDKNESFDVQQDAVMSMVERHGSEFPFSSTGDDGYAVADSSSISIDSRQEIREAELSLRFLQQSDYNPAVRIVPRDLPRSDFSITPSETLASLPSSISNANGLTADFTITGEDSDIDLYIISDQTVLKYTQDANDITLSENLNICKSFDDVGNRVYSSNPDLGLGSQLSNGLVRSDTADLSSSFDYYDGTWTTLGSVEIPCDVGYTSENGNNEIKLNYINGNKQSIYRGFPMFRYDFTSETDFTFNSNVGVSLVNSDTWYGIWDNANTVTLFSVIDTSGASISTDTTNDNVGWTGLDSAKDYRVYFGVIPPSIPNTDFVRYVYNLGFRSRTFTHK